MGMEASNPLFLSPFVYPEPGFHQVSCGANHACLSCTRGNMQLPTDLMQVPRLYNDETIVEATINTGNALKEDPGSMWPAFLSGASTLCMALSAGHVRRCGPEVQQHASKITMKRQWLRISYASNTTDFLRRFCYSRE